MQKSLAATALLALSTQALAHPGHDHSHWLAEPVHAITALAVAAIVATGVYLLRKRSKAQKTDK